MQEENDKIINNPRVEWLEHEGRKILYVDSSNLEGEEMIKLIDDARSQIVMDLIKDKKTVLVIYNVEGVVLSSNVLKAAKNIYKKFPEVRKNTILAVIGYSGMGKAIGQTLVRNLFFADSIKEAKELLYKKANKKKM